MFLPVSVIHTLDNRAFIVDGEKWTPVPVGTTLEEARLIHRKMFPFVYAPKPKPKFRPGYRTIKMKSLTHRNVYYYVRVLDDGRVECDCPGYRYRHECRHTKHVLSAIRKLKGV